MNKHLGALFSLILLALAACVPAAVINIDFGPNPTPGNWNTISNSFSGTSLNGLIDTEGNILSANYICVNGFGGTITSGVSGTIYPDTAGQDASYVSKTDSAQIKITGLTSQTSYTLTFFGSRANVSNTRLLSVQIGSEVQTLDTANNTARTLVFASVAPDTSGTITIDLRTDSSSQSSYSYLSVMQIEGTFAKKGLYVSPTGDDNNSGTIDLPFKTIQRAADTAQPGDIIYIRGGTYRETVRPARSGNAARMIQFMAYENEPVVITGCDPITGWTRYSGDVWKTANNWNMGTDGTGNTLFVNGELKFEAREGAENDPLDLNNWNHITSGKLKSEYFTSNDIKGWGDGFWNGAKVRHHTHDWVIRNSVIADYDSSAGKITFETPLGVTSQKHTIGFYIYDTLKALDHPGEWFKDRQSNTLFYQTQPGQNPNSLDIEFKHREYGFDLRGRDYIRIHGITFRGVSIRTDGYCDHNLYDSNLFYGYNKGGKSRFYLSGTHNVFRDNEVRQTWGSVVSVSGSENQLVNNYLHDIGYDGTARCISMTGTNHLVSYNTVSRIARSFLDGYPYRSEFCCNVFENGARLSWDTGFFDGDSGRGNGGGCIVHHNIFRNTNSIGIFCSFYAGLDLVIHHNLIYDITPISMRGGQMNFLKYYHNTIIGNAPIGNTNASSFAFEANYNNNLWLSGDKITSIGVDCRGNINYQPNDFVDFNQRDLRLAANSSAIDAGVVLPGINDDYSGSAPDAGALEYGQPLWKAGHNFDTPPVAQFNWTQLPGTNIFDNGQFNQSLSGWNEVGSPRRINGNAWNTMGTGLSHIGGYCIQLNPGDGLWKRFTQLKPNTWYVVGSETRLLDQKIEMEQTSAASTAVNQSSHRGENFIDNLAADQWVRYDNIDFGILGQYNQLELTYTRPPGAESYGPTAVLEAHLGTPSGQLLGTFEYDPVVHDAWHAVRIDIRQLSGRQSLCLVARGPGAAMMRLATLRLLNSNPLADHMLTIGVRNFGRSEINTPIGRSLWMKNYELFRFKTGPSATSADLYIQNNGLYDAYLDRLALFEDDQPAQNAAPSARITQSTTLPGSSPEHAVDGNPATAAQTDDQANSFWQADLGALQSMNAIELTAPVSTPGQLSNIKVSIWDRQPGAGGEPLWSRTCLTDHNLSAGETLILKATDFSDTTGTELQAVDGRYVRVELLGHNRLDTGVLSIAEIKVWVYDEIDLVTTDGEESRQPGIWQVDFSQLINIGRIILYNVDTDDYRQLSHFKVSVWDRNPDLGGHMIWQKDYMPTGSVGRGRTFTIDGSEISADGLTRLASVPGRMVRVENNNGTAQLSLADARIYSSAKVRPVDNIAMTGIASQSANHYADGGQADIAVNGIIVPTSDFTTAAYAYRPWWQVDLQQASVIDQVVLFNRTDAAERIGNFRVSIWNGDPEAGGIERWRHDYSYSNGDLPAGGSLTITNDTQSSGLRLDEVTDARILRVQLLGSNLLSLAEVQVWRKPNRTLISDINSDRLVNLPDLASLSDCWAQTEAANGMTQMDSAGTLAYWPADNDSGIILTDASGHGADATLYNGADWSDSGYSNRALKFDGGNDYVKIDQPDLVDGLSELTLAAWFKPNSKRDNVGIVVTSAVDQSRGYFGLLLTAYGTGNPVEFRAMRAHIHGPDYSGPVGQWTHAVGVWKSGAIQELYLNGELAASSSSPPSGTIDMDNWYMGTDRLASHRYFNGLIDEIRIYPYAMLPNQVRQLYQMQTGWACTQVDINKDGAIGVDDMVILADEWLKTI